MSTGHSDIGPELRQLAQAILDRLDPAVRAAAAMAAQSAGEPGRCQQVWCPVCALAALINGEQHPLLTVVAEHSVALLAVLRSMAGGSGPGSGPQDDDAPQSPPANGRYQHIPMVVEQVGAEE